ncbi:hypothetical protein LLE49_02975 [Alicyclobacillus tolerans]|uniref:hypothetical protein n=1 Tax=Alicyclobacillus tolerans TaxID=90970 RepID=UPI001F22FD69|nr:hypothetical protein [Alicyclobacillus tolerans]MCF8563703.1 hypothetical protein [Alicyclobacillus tolerans]
MSWVYEARLYDSKSVASYVAMCVRDDQLMRGLSNVKVQVFRTRKGNYGVRYRNQASVALG